MQTMKTLNEHDVIEMSCKVLSYYRKHDLKEIGLTDFRTALKSRCDVIDAWYPTDEQIVDALRQLGTVTLLGHATPKTTVVFHNL